MSTLLKNCSYFPCSCSIIRCNSQPVVSFLLMLHCCTLFVMPTTSRWLVCVAILAFISYASTNTLPETYDFEIFPTGTYKLHTEKLHWGDAWLVCRQESAYLVIINDDTEAFIISGIFARVPQSTSKFCHVGFHDMFVEGQYVTVHGDDLSATGYTTWGAGEPDNYFGEHCGGVAHDAHLNDIDCGVKYVFICEKIAEEITTPPTAARIAAGRNIHE